MKRTRHTVLLKQRHLARKLTRRSARRSKVLEWSYRDHICSVGVDVASGRFVGRINNIEGEAFLVANHLDELLTAFHNKVDAHLSLKARAFSLNSESVLGFL